MTTHARVTQVIDINKDKDFIERVGWTAIQVAGGLLLTDLESGHIIIWQAILQAAALAALKVIIAQRVGQHPDGSAIPGGVIDVKQELS